MYSCQPRNSVSQRLHLSFGEYTLGCSEAMKLPVTHSQLQAMQISICFIGNRTEEDEEEKKKNHIQGKIFCTDIKNYLVKNKLC